MYGKLYNVESILCHYKHSFFFLLAQWNNKMEFRLNIKLLFFILFFLS